MPSINGDVHVYTLLSRFFDQIFHVRMKIAISEPKRILYVAVLYITPTGRDITLVPSLVAGRSPLHSLYVVGDSKAKKWFLGCLCSVRN
jgi:hypothetical protein